ncbi:MAG: 3-isopropylmalate dehydratase [Candidatus Hatepunaea meridiana]|nr:3-isopropylmalate dehydratase [Candidatus Hatepunaea meridiana]
MTKKPIILSGRVRFVPVENVDTDMIFHNSFLHITDREKMAPHIFGNLEGYKDFPEKAKPGDILVVGHNFGCGSSRQQAVDGFIALGIAAVIGKSFGAIYKRNAINAGWPLIECSGIVSSGIKDGDEIELNLKSGTISRTDGSIIATGKPFSDVQRDIYFAGGLLELAI